MSLARTGRWNPGGGNWIEIIPAVGVIAYQRPTLAGTPALTLATGWGFTRVYCTPDTVAYSESKKDTDNGYLHEVAIKGFCPDDTALKRTDLEALLAYRSFLVRFRDNAGLTRLAGTNTEPLLAEYDFSTDADVAGSRGYSLTFSGTLTAPCAYE